jgi:hypothetical protein
MEKYTLTGRRHIVTIHDNGKLMMSFMKQRSVNKRISLSEVYSVFLIKRLRQFNVSFTLLLI